MGRSARVHTNVEKLCQNIFKISKSRDITVNGKVAHAYLRQRGRHVKRTGDAGLEKLNNYYSLLIEF